MQLLNFWLNDRDGYMELRADFANDRHHAMMIEKPYGKEEVSRALHEMAANIARDWKLTPNASGKPTTEAAKPL